MARSEAYERLDEFDDPVMGDGTKSYLSCLLLQHQQLVDRTLDIGLHGVSLDSISLANINHTFARASASGMSLSASFVKSFSAFSRPPSDILTNVWKVDCVV